MNPKDTSRILDTVAEEYIPDEVNLLPKITARLERKTFTQTLRARPALAILLVLLSLALLTGVAYAIGRSLGYIPGVGIVEQGSGIYILAEPVSVKRDGITVKVNHVVVDSTRTFVDYQVDGIPPVASGFPICTDPPALQLPDGSTLGFTSGGEGGMESVSGKPMSFETSYTFPPLPAQTQKVMFLSPCQMPAIKLVLVPAPVNFVTPAAEIGATFEASGPKFASTPTLTPIFQGEATTPEPYPYSFPATPTSVPNGSGLYLDKVIEMENSYILTGNFTDAGDLPGALEIGSTSASEYRPHIEEARGKPVQFTVRTDIQPEVNWGGVYNWAYEIPKPVNGPLKITLDHVNIQKSDTTQFQFDTGPNPQVGQKWQLNLPLKLGGYDYVIDWVEMLKKGYLVRWHSGIDVPEGTSFTLTLPGILPSTSEGPWGEEDRSRKDQVIYAQNFLMNGPGPTGILTVELTLYQTVPLPGPWTLNWMPPNP